MSPSMPKRPTVSMACRNAATVLEAFSESDSLQPIISCVKASVSRCRYATPSSVSTYVISATHSRFMPSGRKPLTKFGYLRHGWLEFVV